MIHSANFNNLKAAIANRNHPDNNGDSFIYSPAYYALTGRRGAWICQGKQTISVMCQHPNIKNTLLIFPEIGSQKYKNGQLIASMIEHINHQQFKVKLARFEASEIAQVAQYLTSNSAFEVRQVAEKDLDWQYPVHILDTKQVSYLDGANFRNIRQKIRKINETDIQLIPIHSDHAIKYLKACTKYWEGNQILYNDRFDSGNAEFYQFLFQTIEKHPDLFDGFVIKYGNRISGFSIWDQIKGPYANLLANLVDIHIRGMSEYQMVLTCRILYDKGIQYLNRGGSERAGLDQFKKKFSPIESLSLYSADIDYKPHDTLNFMPFIQDKSYHARPFSLITQ